MNRTNGNTPRSWLFGALKTLDGLLRDLWNEAGDCTLCCGGRGDGRKEMPTAGSCCGVRV